MRISRYINNFCHIPIIEKQLLMRGFFISVFVYVIVKFLPLKYYYSLLQKKPNFALHFDKEGIALKLTKKTIYRLEKICPFVNNCLIKSIVLKLLLTSLGVNSNIAFGLLRFEQYGFEAHAYIKIDNRIVFLKNNKFNEIFTIV